MKFPFSSWFNRSGATATAPPATRQISNAENSRMLRARFDNQFTTEDNRQLWATADAMSVDASANFGIRRLLRMRCRQAYHNNPFAMGCANRLANFVIGSGPKLHLGTKSEVVNGIVERAFNTWARKVKLARKFRTSRAARFYNGEGFLLLRTNPKIKHAVKLDLFEVEADQVQSPLFGIFPLQYPDQWFDGVILDPWGNPETYHVLRQHPGAFGAFLVLGTEADPWPAQYVIHDYAHLRPAQQRGIPDMVPAADLFEELRRTRRAVVAAHETAADYAGMIQTEGPASDDNTPGNRANVNSGFGTDADYMAVRRRQMAVLPAGWKMSQLKPEQPTTTYNPFVESLLTEASQTLDMPLFIVMGDARLANMASAYVVTQSFVKRVLTDRQEYDEKMDQVWDEWLPEARRIPGLIPAELPEEPDHSWRWDRVSSHADPSKTATAQAQRLKSGVRSPSLECADDGVDYDEQCKRAAADYGVDVPTYKKAVFQATFSSTGTPAPAVLQVPIADDADIDEPEDGGEDDESPDQEWG
jgi:capsid protein